MRKLSVVLSTALLLGATPSVPLAVLPIQLDDRVVAVQGTVNGRSLWFDLDSGATQSIVDSTAAKSLQLPVLGVRKVSGAGAGSVDALRLGAFTVELAGVTFSPVDTLAVDLSNAGVLRQGGILGYDFFRRYVLDVDFDAHRVSLYAPQTYVYKGRGTAVPLILRPPRAFVRVTVAALGVGPEVHELRLDTGSSDAVDDDIVLRSRAPRRPITGGVGIGSRFAASLGTVSELRLGPFTLHDLPSAAGGVQLLGNGALDRFNIVFDFSRSVMYLTPRLNPRP